MLCINIAFQILKFNWVTFFHIHEKMHIFFQFQCFFLLLLYGQSQNVVLISLPRHSVELSKYMCSWYSKQSHLI